MIRASKILLFFTVIVLLSWLLPWTYDFVTSRPPKYPFTLYSGVIHDFAILEVQDKSSIRKDLSGNIYTESEFDSILPLFYYRQLISDERFPSQINGVDVTPKTAQIQNFIFRHTPGDINITKPALFPLLETMSGRVDLQMPDDVFRAVNSIEFINSESNRIEKEKSTQYYDILQKKGVCFPIRLISGNPTTRKDYDEGYFLIDDSYQLYHLKQTKGRPYVRKIEYPEDIKIKNIFVTEFKGKKFHAFLVDERGQLYVLETKTYNLKPIPISPFYPEKESLSIIGNAFDWTIQITNESGNRLYAIDADNYKLLKKMEYPVIVPTIQKSAKYIFPFQISFTSPLDNYVFPRLETISLWVLILNVLLVITYSLIRRRNPSQCWSETLCILIFGIYGFITFLLFGSKKDNFFS
ncbi:MAG: DUF4857 domain-containing protein [Bacteroidales bacterium]|nr:DUF4857 domain-containing protein [Bacteroidales bacterium]